MQMKAITQKIIGSTMFVFIVVDMVFFLTDYKFVNPSKRSDVLCFLLTGDVFSTITALETLCDLT